MSQDDPTDWFTELADGGFARDAEGGTGLSAPLPPERRKAEQRRRRGRRIGGLVAIVVILALIGTYVGLTLNAPIGAASATVVRPPIAQPLAAKIAMPSRGEAAVSISGGDAYLGSKADGVFASGGGNGELPMASISKLVTALVVLDAKPLGASGQGAAISWTTADAKLYDKYYLLNATIAAMKAHTTMSEHDALETMLVVSACNYAEAVSDWAFGSQANFLAATRKWLAANGLNHTVMVESTGIDVHNVSTPSNLIALGKIAMKNKAIASMVSMGTLDVPGVPAMPNTNDLLGVGGIDGIKTGTLNGSDLLFHANLDPGLPNSLSVTGVVMDGASRASVDSDVTAMLTSISAGFHQDQLGNKGELVGTYSTPWGSKARMILARDASTLSWSNTAITSTMSTTTLKTGATGEAVGNITWKVGPSTVSVPIVLAGHIRGPSTLWRLTHPAELLGK